MTPKKGHVSSEAANRTGTHAYSLSLAVTTLTEEPDLI